MFRRGPRALLVFLAAALMLLAIGGSARAADQIQQNSFPHPSALEPNVDFWVNAFTYWGHRDFVLHDRDQIWRIYEVYHVPGVGAPSGYEIKWANAYLKDKYSGILNGLAAGQPPVGADAQRVAAMFKGQPLSAYSEAAQNLRVQQGLRQPFRAALLRARYYCPRMKRVFEEFGLPPELVALAAVESGYHPRARSSAGAVGIWQFTRSTGRQFMRITRYRDDRLDPMRSTVAAARLLQSNYNSLGSWPLAITAYDYGEAGMARAAAQYGDNLVRIVRRYDAPHFGFAVKNYYAEFLAAARVYKHEDVYFPGIQYEEAPPPRPSSPILRRVIHHRRYRHYYRRHHYHHYRHVRRAHLRHISYSHRHEAKRPKHES